MFSNLVTWVQGLGGSGGSEIANAVGALVNDLSGQMTDLLPIGIGLMAVMAMPRIVKKIVHTFI